MRASTSSPSRPVQASDHPPVFLRHFSKLTCAATLFLIFAGGMVTSTGSGLAVPDWPLSYGMVFPPMVGGVFYEHGHRMVATAVGFLMLCLTIAIAVMETRRWVKVLAFAALGAVIAQGILGGITVMFFLPTAVSVAHGILAQTFFVLTIVLAYSQSIERAGREKRSMTVHCVFLKTAVVFLVLIYLQLLAGAVMRHTESGLAVPDFPTMGGEWWPSFSPKMMSRINAWRFDMNLDPVTAPQVIYHLLHRLGALILLVTLIALNVAGRALPRNHPAHATMIFLDVAVGLQITLGILTVLTLKEALLTSFHVVTGAGILGLTVLLILRSSPLSWNGFLQTLRKHE